jgi:hypothetical protein
MRKLTTREIALLLVVGVLGVIGWIYGRGGPLGGRAMTAVDPSELNYGAPPIVELARLSLEPEPFDSGSRNLFNYYTPPPPPPKERPKPAPRPPVERSTQQAAPVQRHERPPPPPPAAPKPPRPDFRYIGFMGPKDNKIAVLEQGESVVLAELGDVVDKKYKILEFKYEMLVLGYTDARWADETHELPMKR